MEFPDDEPRITPSSKQVNFQKTLMQYDDTDERAVTMSKAKRGYKGSLFYIADSPEIVDYVTNDKQEAGDQR